MSSFSQQNEQVNTSNNSDSSPEGEPIISSLDSEMTPLVLPPYSTVPTVSLHPGDAQSSSDDFTDPSFSMEREFRARRNRQILDALLDILQQNEENMLRFILDQSYQEHLEQSNEVTNRTLNVIKREFNKELDSEYGCMICQENFEEGDELAELACQHKFHYNCLDEWIKRRTVCPFCEADIPTSVIEEKEEHLTS